MAEDKDKKKKKKAQPSILDDGPKSPSKNYNRRRTIKRRQPAPEPMRDKEQVGAPDSNKNIKKLQKRTEGSIGDIRLRYNTGKSAAQLFKADQKSKEVPNPGLGKKTEDFGDMGKRTYSSGNPGGLKKGSGKSVSSMKTPERSTRSKIGGAAKKVAGAVRKGKQAIRKINNKAGAVKNRLEEKVLKKKKK